MSKIDLIIDALLVAESSVWSDKIAEALAAARELRDADSKKAQWGKGAEMMTDRKIMQQALAALKYNQSDWFGKLEAIENLEAALRSKNT